VSRNLGEMRSRRCLLLSLALLLATNCARPMAPGRMMKCARRCIQTVPPPVLGAAFGNKLRAAHGAGAHDEVRAAFRTVDPDVLANFNGWQLRVFFASDQSKSSSVLSYLSALSAKHGSNVRTATDQVSGRVDFRCAYSPLILT
jgi:hypothetical protein